MSYNIRIIPLFSFVIYPCKLNISKKQEDIIINIAKNIEYKTGKDIEHIRSKSITVFNDYKELEFLGNLILDDFYNFKNNVLRYEQTDFRITTSWFTKTLSGANSHFHNHNNSMYSGCFYFGNDEDNTAITFTNFAYQTSYLVKPTEWNDYNCTSWTFKPKNNSCIYFPSHLPHSVERNNSKQLRHSLAFNIMPIGNIGWGDSQYSYGFKNK